MEQLISIYKIKNLINGKCYVGQDSKNDPEYLGSGKLISRAIKKYKKDSFKKEIIVTCDTKIFANVAEKFFIDRFNTKFSNGYNLTDGGQGGNLGEEVNRKIRGRKMAPFSEEQKRNMSVARKGKHPWNYGLTKETDERILKYAKKLEHPKSEEHKIKMRKPKSEEHVKNISESHKGKCSWKKGLTKETDERIRKGAESLKCSISDEFRKNQSERMKERWKNSVYRKFMENINKK